MITLLATALGLFAVTPARAASPALVTADWKGGASGLPSDVTMYAYIPDKVATNPPLLTIIHYCGGSAQAVFGQASGLISAADQYGFIVILPSNANASGSNGRCWDVTSSKAHTRDGGGDSHAIIQMVKYALTQYKANTDRVYSTGDSSGAMMTELLLALYPDIYKAGASFAGVPAGCANEFDGSGLCGLLAQTAQQWGDRVRAMYSGYSGHRPRVQLFHGDADGTITYKNLAEAIKEWTNVLSLSTTPTSTASGLELGTHQASRQSWTNSCGYVVFDALTSIGGDHGPSDALFQSNFVLPFLGLDSQTAVNAAVDPEIQQCASGGTGGAPGTGGVAGAGGAPGTGGVGTGGAPGTGGVAGTGGAPGTGGVVETGGVIGTGGVASTGGINGSGGVVGTGGVARTGGVIGSGGNLGTGGLPSAGGTTGRGGVNGTGDGSGADASIDSGGVISTGGTSYAVDAPYVNTTEGAAGNTDAGLAVDANVATGGISGESGGAGGSAAFGDGPAAHDLSGFDAPTYTTSIDALVINGDDTGVGGAAPEQTGRHGLYAIPSCNFGRGTPGSSGVFILLALLLLRRRCSRHRT
jgi:poly(hydroxyalkanoate) depolymerase family esterase